MCKQVAVMPITHSKFFCLVIYLFKAVLRLFFRCISFLSSFIGRSSDVVWVFLPPVCGLFSLNGVCTFLMIFLILVHFAHRPFAPFARNNTIWSATRCLVFLSNQYRAFFAIPSCRSDHTKIQAAALTVLFFHAASSLSVWIPDCDVQNTG